MEARIEALLKRNQLSITESRKKILALFLKAEAALAHQDIEKQSRSLFDRVTIYRTLQAFLEKGLIHTIPTADNSIRYALCHEACAQGHHHDNHVHFVCHQCNSTTCLPEVTIPDVTLPKGFKADEAQMVVNGICGKCRGLLS